MRILLPLLVLQIFLNASCEQTSQDEEDAQFKLVAEGKSGIGFRNNVEEGLNTNVLMYEYFYNGGGVAAGDLNGDGLDDLYFTSNMEENHLYLNKGNLTFTEIALQAGVQGRNGPWKTGVSLVDVNADGKLDIYLCYSGNLPAEKKRNQLFINYGNNAQGIPFFKDEAASYGLDHPGNSTHAVFFDYDRDQDLDMILVNHNPKSLPILDESSTADLLSKDDENSGLLFFENPGMGKPFSNVTKALGIQNSSLSYGLAVGISDFNKDGWLDFYVSNDYTIPDFLYLNQQGKDFKNIINTSLGHFSQFSMGNDVADVNNDLLPDILTLDMLPEDNKRQKLLMAPDNYEKFDFNLRVGFGHQYMRNMLQLNQGVNAADQNPYFSEVAQQAGISNTDWSWSALLADYDNDGWKDLYVTNGYLRDYTNLDFLKYMGDYVQNNQQDIQREKVLELVEKMPSSNLTNYMFKNEGYGMFNRKTSAWGMDKSSNSNGAVYTDLDNDGDLEIVVNNINQPAFLFENTSNKKTQKKYFISFNLQGEGANTFGLGTTVTTYAKGKKQVVEQQPHRSYQSSVSTTLHIGLDSIQEIDSVVVKWNSGKIQVLQSVKADRFIILKESEAKHVININQSNPTYFTQTNPTIISTSASEFNDFKRQPQLVFPQSFFGPVLEKGDLNGDGRPDIFVGADGTSPSKILFQSANGKFTQSSQTEMEICKGFETGAALLEDLDADGDLDIYEGLGGYGNVELEANNNYKDHIYLNDGKGHFSYSSAALPAMTMASQSCVTSIQLDGDKLPDLFIGSRVIPGSFPQIPQSHVLKNLGNGKFEDVSSRYPLACNAGMISDAQWIDLDGNKVFELVLVGNWMPIRIFNFKGNSCQETTSDFFEHSSTGLWNRLEIADLDNNGKPEIIVGNLGENSQLKVKKNQPIELYAKDFDANGAIDPILTTYVMGKKYPFLTRDELLDQLSMMRNRFTSYESFASAELEKIFSKDELTDAQYLNAEVVQTQVFSLNKQGKFEVVALPLEVQQSPIFAINVSDFDADGKKDILFAGNIHHGRLRLGNMDASYGLMIKGQGELKFKVVPQQQTGLWLKGDTRNILSIGNRIIIGMNGLPIQEYQFKK